MIVGRWLYDNVSREVRDRESLLFRKDEWLRRILKLKFGRIFVLFEHKKVSIAYMRRLGFGAGGGGWWWRKRLCLGGGFGGGVLPFVDKCCFTR
jgi:hypothetical protein